MKPDYKNWIPKGMLFSLIAETVLSLALLLAFGIFGSGVGGKLRIVLGVVFGIAFVVCAKYSEWCIYAYRSFSYDGERKLSKQIIDGTAEHITLPEGGVGLDIGCGSGALTIACVKRNPQGKMVGIDRWGKEYASFSLPLCEKNAAAAGAMLYVVVEELIPEMSQGTHSNIGTVFFAAGFSVMLTLDVALG